MESRSIKIIYQNEIRRVNLQENESTFDGTKELAKNLFGALKEPFHFRYEDDERDVITISSNDDLIEALRVTKTSGINLKLVVAEIRKEEPQAQGIPPPPNFNGWNQNDINKHCAEWKRQFHCQRKGSFLLHAAPIAFKIISAIVLFKLLFCVLSGRCCILPLFLLGIGVLLFGKKLRRGFFRRHCGFARGQGFFNGQCPLANWCQEPTNDRQQQQPENFQDAKKEREEEVVQRVNEQQELKEEEEIIQEEVKEVSQASKREGSSFARNLKQLEDMGFLDRDRNIAVLVQNKGNVVDAVRDLLG